MYKQLLQFKTFLIVCLLAMVGTSNVWAEDVTVSMNSFTSIEGNVGEDENISYKAEKGTASTAPVVNSNEIRVYQNGGKFTVTAKNGVKIKSVTLGSSMGTTVTYSIDQGDASENQSISANSTITIGYLDCTTVLFTCTGTTKNTRLYVNSLSVTYSAGAIPTCASPTFTPVAGTYVGTQSVTLGTTTNGATIYYTTDGTDPTTDSSVYSGAINVASTTTIKAIAVKGGNNNSSVASASYNIIEEINGTQTDVITAKDLGGDAPSSYSDFSGLELTSGAQYAGNTAYSGADKNTADIQMRATNSSGIVTTKSGGLAKRIIVVVGTGNTTANRTVTIYGKNTPYTNGGDLSDNSKKGEIIGEFTITDVALGTMESFDVESDYGYIAIASNGAVYLQEIVVSWLEAAPLQQEGNISIADATVAFGSSYTIDQNDVQTNGALTIGIENPAIASVSGTTITPLAVGSTRITVSSEETEVYTAASDEFILTVTAPEGKTTAATGTTTIFEERFSQCENTGGNDGSWSGSIAQGTLSNTDESEWQFENGSAASGCAKFGTGSKLGKATTRTLGTTGTLTLTFKAGAWNGKDENTTLNLSVSEGSIDNESVTLTKGEFKTYTATISNATAETQITFEAGKSSSNRFFLDDVVITKTVSITAKLNASCYATYCSEYPLDFSEATDYSAWQITDIDDSNNITFEKVTGDVKGGTGLFLMGTANATITLASVNSSTELSKNLLEGTLAPTYFDAGEIYGLAGDTFKKNYAGTIKANKAYLDATKITVGDSESTRAFTFVFVDPTTGITETQTVSAEQFGEIFNLAGQRISQPQKGVNIINGKKVLVK